MHVGTKINQNIRIDATTLLQFPYVVQLSFNVSVVNDNIPEDAEMFSASLTFDPADQDEPVDIVTVLPDVAMVTILNNDGKLRIDDHEGFGIST